MKHKISELFSEHNVTGVAFDSRKVCPGDAYFAIKGDKSDGNNYIEQAFEKGAIVAFSEVASQDNPMTYKVENTRLALAIGAGIIYPKLPEKLIAVTGTNGKTSVVSYCFQILDHLKIPAASIGTIGITTTAEIAAKISHKSEGELTMSDPITFRRNLHELAVAGAKVVAFEASSHGIVQKRMGNVMVDVAGFTSFSQDHLDYHSNMEEYLSAKLELFSLNLKEGAKAVLPYDINSKDKILAYLDKHHVAARIIGSKELSLEIVGTSLSGQKIEMSRMGEVAKIQTDIIGSFQASNLFMAAELVAQVADAGFTQITKTLSVVKAVAGRMQRATQLTDDFQIFIDYSHTPDSVEKSLQELAKLLENNGKLYVILGCGGDRDKSKRPLMGEVAVNNADILVVTDDNPRTEDAKIIRQQIIAGAQLAAKKAKNVTEIGDRKLAIESTIDLLQKDDILLIAGKGHEDYQIIGTEKQPFSDMLITQNYIKK